MAGNSEGARKGAQKRLAKLQAQGGKEAVSEHFAKLAAKANNKKAPKRGLAALKESDPEKFKEITSMGGKNRWKPSTKRQSQKERSNELQRKLRHQRQLELAKIRQFDDNDAPSPKKLKPRKPEHRKPEWGEDEDTGW
jgi:hypothetical protein